MASKKEPAIFITGISRALGRLLTQKLHRQIKVVGIARKPYFGKPKDVEVHEIDIRKRKAEDLFRTHDVQAVIHLGLMHNPRKSDRDHHIFNVHGTVRVLEYVQKYGVQKFVMLSTANIYGPLPDTPYYIKENAPLSGSRNFPEIRDVIEVDMYTQSFFWQNPEIDTVILRPVHVLGPTVKNAASKYLRLKNPPYLLGFDPVVQLIHESDLVEAIALALKPGVKGIFNVTGPGEVPVSAIFKELRKTPVPVPSYIAKPLYALFWKTNFTSFPYQEWDFIKYTYLVDGSRAKEALDFLPEYTLQETIRSVIR